MNKFAIGIPSLNEADNIANLTRQLDKAALELGISVHIINADNNSNDGTARIFNEQTTVNLKTSIITKTKGKGHNVLAIFEFIANSPDIEYCFLIDADILSFDSEWLRLQYEQFIQGVDYVLPQYKRKFIEGNATNHFAYPMLRYLMDGPAPRQPIAGDIGLSKQFIRYLLDQSKHSSVYGYGIDIFMSLNSIYFDGVISEIFLAEKVHKPSFPKMVKIFQEEAAAFYSTRQNHKKIKARFIDPKPAALLLEAKLISNTSLTSMFNEALSLYSTRSNLISDGQHFFEKEHILDIEWAQILAEHEKIIYQYTPDNLAASLTPYYLLRTLSYLRDAKNPKQANKIIEKQTLIITSLLRSTNNKALA